jgi:hypothetical protein
MSGKSEKILVWGEASMILMAIDLVGGWSQVKVMLFPLGHLFNEKWFDIVLAFAGTMFGYWKAKRHIEGLMDEIVKTLGTKYATIFRERAFHRAVSTMLPELPDFHLRPNTAFSTQTADAVSEFTQWSAMLDPAHTPDKSMEMVGKEAYILAADLVEKDMGYREDESTGNYGWEVGIFGLPAGWEVKESPDISIYNWDTGIAVQKYEVMKETARTADSIHYRWMWNPKNVPCGVYVGVTNSHIGGKPVIGNIVKDRVRIFFKRENGRLIKTHETIPWD